MKTRYFIFIALILGMLSCDMSESPKHMSLTINSIESNDDVMLTGGKYRIINNNNVIGDFSVENGTITIITLPLGNYVVQEVAPPYGYVGEQKQVTFVMDEADNKSVTFTYKKDIPSRFLPTRMDVTFYDNYRKRDMNTYTAVRIGEYYWVNSNFTHWVDWGYGFENANPITQEVLNRYLDRARLDKSQYQLSNVDDFEKYYGRYYSRPSLNYMGKYGEVHDKATGVKISGWKFPSLADTRQLFAMCPFNTSWDPPHTSLNERDVRFALSPKEGDNPLLFDLYDPKGGGYKTYWFSAQHATNKYGFNLMPGGARLNGPTSICNGYGPVGGCYPDGVLGDLYGTFYVAGFAAVNDKGEFTGVGVHDYLETSGQESYHLFNVRWCKPISDYELGYKLYIDAEQTDIKKLDLNDPVPTGYSELPRGYLRGFYVQYILDNPNPSVTVADIVQYAKNVQDTSNFQ